MAARRRRLRAVGARRPDARAARGRPRPRRLVGHRRHKWLNVTYDSGIAFVRDPIALRRTFAALPGTCRRATASRRCTTRRSRRSGPGRWRCGPCCARSVAAASPNWWSALRVAALRRRACRRGPTTSSTTSCSTRCWFALGDAGARAALIARIQDDGGSWCGPTQWNGETAMRISVSGWSTSDDDVERSLASILECAGPANGGS